MATSIREAHEGDDTALAALHEEAFGRPSVAALVADLRDDSHAVSLVAVDEGGVVGHVMVTSNWLDDPRRLIDVGVLSPLGVLPRSQGRGLGSALVEAAVAATRDRGYPLLFLEGSPDYYGRFGFRPAGGLGFEKPSSRIPEPGFQVLPLSADATGLGGRLVYRQAFWEHDCVGLRD